MTDKVKQTTGGSHTQIDYRDRSCDGYDTNDTIETHTDFSKFVDVDAQSRNTRTAFYVGTARDSVAAYNKGAAAERSDADIDHDDIDHDDTDDDEDDTHDGDDAAAAADDDDIYVDEYNNTTSSNTLHTIQVSPAPNTNWRRSSSQDHIKQSSQPQRTMLSKASLCRRPELTTVIRYNVQ